VKIPRKVQAKRMLCPVVLHSAGKKAKLTSLAMAH